MCGKRNCSEIDNELGQRSQQSSWMRTWKSHITDNIIIILYPTETQKYPRQQDKEGNSGLTIMQWKLKVLTQPSYHDYGAAA